ncbi:MAG: hypothetical protein HYR85_24525 [Planctomycetes bacterium]|nr:hypothetical protein [Planctomycetota bacterium]MBI3845772.1 hypothetical protein [Planctomycetota bacterium]
MASLDFVLRLAPAIVLVMCIAIPGQRVQAQRGGGGLAPRTKNGETSGDLLAGIAGMVGRAGTPLSRRDANFGVAADVRLDAVGLLLHILTDPVSSESGRACNPPERKGQRPCAESGLLADEPASTSTPRLVSYRIRSLAICTVNRFAPLP